LAAAQFNVVSLDQLLSIGFTYHQVWSLVDRGYLHRLFRGVFAVGHRNVGPWGWLMAAWLSLGPESFLSHRTSAATRGFVNINTRQIELTIPGKGARRNGLIVHRTSRAPERSETTTRYGIRISSVPRMLVEVAPTATMKELDHYITMAARKNVLDITAVERAFERYARSPGIAKLKEAFAAYRPRPDRKSELEREFDEELDNHPDIPKPQTNVFLLGRFEADCYWHEQQLVVELDGRPYHIAARDIDKDAYKDGQLLRAQIRTLRLKDMRWQLDRAGCMEDVRSLLGLPPQG
jgi:hypothetical protein